MKHETATTVRRLANGTIIWRLPAGQEYREPPRPVLPRPRARPVYDPRPPLPPEQPEPYDEASYGAKALWASLARPTPADDGENVLPAANDPAAEEPPF